MEFLSTIPSTEILKLLEDNIIAQLAARHYTTMTGNVRVEGNWLDSAKPIKREAPITTTTTMPPPPPQQQQTSQSTPDRAKRPLNAFMAFRSKFLLHSQQTSQLIPAKHTT